VFCLLGMKLTYRILLSSALNLIGKRDVVVYGNETF
jgi:hypothetical protein